MRRRRDSTASDVVTPPRATAVALEPLTPPEAPGRGDGLTGGSSWSGRAVSLQLSANRYWWRTIERAAWPGYQAAETGRRRSVDGSAPRRTAQTGRPMGRPLLH